MSASLPFIQRATQHPVWLVGLGFSLCLSQTLGDCDPRSSRATHAWELRNREQNAN